MRIKEEHIALIRSQFEKIESKNDVVQLLTDVKKLMYGEKATPVNMNTLTYYANPEFSENRFMSFEVKKKAGGVRKIHAPAEDMKALLRPLNYVLQCMIQPHPCATGFVPKKSIVNNAIPHAGKNYVLNLDLKDFFHSFDRNRVKLAFMYAPFNLRGDKEPIAFMLASLCTHPFEVEGEIKTVLPQGSPTSPTLTNFLCRNLDRRLNGLAKRYGVTYTRYADDITFSSQHSILNKEKFTRELYRIIEEDQGLHVNESKTRLQKSGFRQEVTGLIVNNKVNVHRRYVKELRMWLYYWEKYGYNKADRIFKQDYFVDKGHVKNMDAKFRNVLAGKLLFLKMVKGEDDDAYLKLLKRFEKLTGYNDPLDKILDSWEKDGIEKAMLTYDGLFQVLGTL